MIVNKDDYDIACPTGHDPDPIHKGSNYKILPCLSLMFLAYVSKYRGSGFVISSLRELVKVRATFEAFPE